MNHTLSFDTRKHIRVQFEGDITIQLVVESDSGNVLEVQPKHILAKGRNVSEGGMAFKLDHGCELSHILKIQFEVQEVKAIDVLSNVSGKRAMFGVFNSLFWMTTPGIKFANMSIR